MHNVIKEKNISIIGFTGKMMCGKDTAASLIHNMINTNSKIIYYADALKGIMMDYFGFTRHQLYDQDGKQEFNEFWGMTNREAMQKIGTDCFRNNFHPDTWIKCMEVAISMLPNNTLALIPDVRFDNEYQLIHDLGGYVIKLVRDNTPVIDKDYTNHVSEAGCKYDILLENNGSLDELYTKLVKIYHNPNLPQVS